MDTPISANQNTPYANLDPNVILNAIESAGFRCSGSLFALNSYENRVYQIGIEDSDPLIAKFYRPGRWSDAAILEEHQYALELNSHEIAVVAPLVTDNKTLHHYQEFRFSLFPRKGGRNLELDNLDHLEWMGRFIGRLHAVGAIHKFKHRTQLNVENNGHKSHAFLLENNFYPDTLKDAFCQTTAALLKKCEERFEQAGIIKNIRLHGDCHVGNILWSDSGPQIVDLDDCLMGPAIQDLWMLITGNNAEQVDLQMNRVLKGYMEFYDFDYRELHLIEALRTLRMISYSAWLARRWEDPAFPLTFPWFNTFSYWKIHLDDLREQVMLLDRVDNGDSDDEEDEG
jgi:Ser/Thr protein kinase RdoA (MazF antagonist)